MTSITFKKIIAYIGLLAIIIVNSFESLAANVNMQQDSKVEFNDKRDIKFYAVKDGDLFTNLKELVPGDKVNNKVVVSNNSKSDVVIYLKTRTDYERIDTNGYKIRHKDKIEDDIVKEEGKHFKEDLLSLIKMNIQLDGQYIYGDENYSLNAQCNGEISNNEYGIRLGTFPKGSQKILDVSILLPDREMGNDYEDTFSAIDWIFYVQGEDVSKPSGNRGSSSSDGGDYRDNIRPSSNTLEISTINQRLGELTSDIISSFNIFIDDNQVPLQGKDPETLGKLAKTGNRVIYLKESLLILGLLIFGLGCIEYTDRKKKKTK